MNVNEPSNSLARVLAIVPAAGRSRRMGQAKQLLNIGGRPMLECVVEPLLAASLQGVLVVTHSALAAQLAEKLGALGVACGEPGRIAVAINDDPASEMIDSIRIGLRWWMREAAPGDRARDEDGFLVCPADQPGLRVGDIELCVAAFRLDPTRVVIAAHEGREGHPIIFPAALAVFVESPACDGGLRELPRVHPDLVTRVDLATDAATRNINTPEDYDRLR